MNRKQSMNAWLVLAAVAVIAALAAFGQLMPVARAQAETPTPAPPKPTPVPMAEMRTEKLPSPALEGNLLGDPAERTVHIVLPPGYSSTDKRYPVVYVMPWGNGEPTDNAYGFKRTIEQLLRKGEIKEMIFVVPDGTNSLGASWFRSSPTIGDYETFATRELVEYMDTHYRTLPARDSRALSGCCSGGTASMRLGLKYPDVFSVIAVTDGQYIDSPDAWPADLETVKDLTELPDEISDLYVNEFVAWWIQAAAGAAPDPDNPPFYCEMPFRIVDGHGEFVTEVTEKIFAEDNAHLLRRYLEQPIRLRGMFIRRSTNDTFFGPQALVFEQMLVDLGVEHDYTEAETYHCGYGWEEAGLKFIADRLVFEE